MDATTFGSTVAALVRGLDARMSAGETREAVVARCRSAAAAQVGTDADGVALVEAALDEVFGLGPLEPALRDAGASEIRIGPPERITVVRGGEPTDLPHGFRDAAHLRSTLERIAASQAPGMPAAGATVTLAMVDGSSVRITNDQGAERVVVVRPSAHRHVRIAYTVRADVDPAVVEAAIAKFVGHLSTHPATVRYTSFRLPEARQYVHLGEFREAQVPAMQKEAFFTEFTAFLKEHCATGPDVTPLKVVASTP